MTTKIKIKYLGDNHTIDVRLNGDWIDLYARETISINGPIATTLKRTKNDSKRECVFEYTLIPLGIAVALPKGYEAIVAPRSSTMKNFKVLQSNSIGIIDWSYRGENDEWKFPALALEDTTIEAGQRICQFRIQLSQKATIWQKLKWLFSNGVEIVEVKKLHSKDRGGFGTTGV